MPGILMLSILFRPHLACLQSNYYYYFRHGSCILCMMGIPVSSSHRRSHNNFLNFKWTYERSNDEILKITNQLYVQKMLHTRWLSYFGHICRMEESRPPKAIMKWDPGLKRQPRGTNAKMVRLDRRRLVWFRCRHENCKRNIARNKSFWRNFIRN